MFLLSIPLVLEIWNYIQHFPGEEKPVGRGRRGEGFLQGSKPGEPGDNQTDTAQLNLGLSGLRINWTT